MPVGIIILSGECQLQSIRALARSLALQGLALLTDNNGLTSAWDQDQAIYKASQKLRTKSGSGNISLPTASEDLEDICSLHTLQLAGVRRMVSSRLD